MEYLIVVLQVGSLIVLILVLRNLLPSYFEEKGKNLATKEDIADITRAQASAQIEFDRNLEQFKGEVQTALSEHDTRFTYLHQRQGEVIGKIYERIADLSMLFDQSLAPVKETQPSTGEQLLEGFKAANELYRYLQRNRLYLDRPLLERLDKFNRKIMELRNQQVPAGSYSPDELSRKINRMVEILINDLPAIRQDIESEMQRLLGMKRN